MSNLPLQPEPETRVRLGSPAELVASVPYLLGFPPRESVVAIGLRGRRSRVCLTLRLDLPAPGSERALADLVAAHLGNARATTAVLLVLTETVAPDGALPRAGLARELLSGLGRSRIGVRDLLCVRSGRWRSYVCAEPACCPPEGKPVAAAAPGAFAAAMVAEGRVVHADRDTLVASVLPTGESTDATRRHFTDAERRHRARAVPAIARHAVLRQIEATLRTRTEAARPLTVAQVADFCVALSEVQLRDACLCWLDGPLADAAEGLWLELARAAVPPYGAPPTTLLALYAYARGDGTYARICADRALEEAPEYAMARLVLEGLERGIAPSAIRELASCVEVAGADA